MKNGKKRFAAVISLVMFVVMMVCSLPMTAAADPEPCETCSGTGKLDCSSCGGTGLCGYCHGEGWFCIICNDWKSKCVNPTDHRYTQNAWDWCPRCWGGCTCTVCGGQKEVTCPACGGTGEKHTCVPSKAWDKDAGGHWHYACDTPSCPLGNNTKKTDEANHGYKSSDPDSGEDYCTCSVCSYVDEDRQAEASLAALKNVKEEELTACYMEMYFAVSNMIMISDEAKQSYENQLDAQLEAGINAIKAASTKAGVEAAYAAACSSMNATYDAAMNEEMLPGVKEEAKTQLQEAAQEKNNEIDKLDLSEERKTDYKELV
ncbi:MAG: DUF1542 domain-containing protein, partial [Eubacterium sp.]|nr:DUF1542 domain-containing protein [Eubacterium sp.]